MSKGGSEKSNIVVLSQLVTGKVVANSLFDSKEEFSALLPPVLTQGEAA